jgi:hypothetical protein
MERRHVGDLGQQAELEDQLIWFALALLVTSALLVFLHGLAVVAALACGVQVYRVGDSGASAA